MSRSRVPLTQLEVPDYDLGLRGKLLRADKVAKAGGSAFCTIIYGLDPEDGVADTPLSSAANGYPDAFAAVDESTRVPLSWRAGTDAVIADLVDGSGTPLEESPRVALARVITAFRSRGLEPVLGFEYECHVLHADDDVLSRGDYGAVRPLGREENAYSLSRLVESGPLFAEFVDRMDSIGVPVEACHSELGPGFFEYALAPLPALRAADAAVRSRLYFRELCAERGLHATFMAKLRIETSGAGGHVHQSVLRDGMNAFAGDSDGLSPLGRNYLGGLLDAMADSTVLFNPFLNSYKRISAGFFVAEQASWGRDDRNAACRVITGPGLEASRIEHRRPGADANPYLAAAGMLAGGLHGIEREIVPGPPVSGGSSSTAPAVPNSLESALAAFRSSTVLADKLGTRLVESYAATRQAELDSFTRWWATTVTDWEKRRYMEHL